jgi:hypothetical protein
MAFLDMLIRAFDGCTGLLEVMTIFLDCAAVAIGIRTYRKHQHAVTKLAHDPKAHVKKPVWWPVVVLTALAIAFTTLAVYKIWRNI